MAKCNLGYICEICSEEVEDITQSDLYLRYVIGEINADELLRAAERHLKCNPVLSQFIVDEAFEAVSVDGPFAKQNLDAADVQKREDLVTRGWQRLQIVRQLQIPISEYPLEEFQRH